MGIDLKNKQNYYTAFIALVFLILPIFIHNDSRVLNIIIMCFIWGVVASAWNLIMGYARVMSFAQIALFAIGAYTSAMLAVHLKMSPWLGMLMGGFAAAFVGLLIGLPCLRLTGIFVAIVTFAVHLILTPILMWGEKWTAGSMGFPVPTPHLFGYVFAAHKLVPWYYMGLGLFFILLFFIYKVIQSPLGLAFVALRDGEPFAKSLGVNDFKYRLIVFGISSFITGIVGGFYAHYYGMLSPSILGLDTFLLVLIMVMFGGLGKFPGAVLGAFSITVLNELLRPTGVLRFVILGIVVIATMIYMPKGLMGIPESFKRLTRKAFTGRGKIQQKPSGTC